MKSIAAKLWTGMMALICIVLILLWLFQIVFLESFYNRIKISDIKKEGIKLSNQLSDSGNSDIENKIEEFAYKNNIFIEAIDSSGNSIYEAGNTGLNGQMPMMMNGSRNELIREALSGKEVETTLTHPKFGNKFMLIGLPAANSGAIIINIPLAPVEETASILKRQLFYITIILLAASLLISFLISRSFTRPILEIEKTTEKMASGDYSARTKIHEKDEIGKLAKAINYLGQELSKTDQLRKDLIANVSHELRTPLSLIRGYAETIRDVSGSFPEKREKQLGIIIEETERLGKIVDDILNLSQLQSGHFALEKTDFSIKELLESALKRYDVLKERTGVQLVLKDSCDCLVYADEKRIQQVLFNLVNNGFNHTPRGGTITIEASTSTDKVRVEISDTGSGINDEDMPYIWERYYKASKNKAAGTGLGLAIVKSVLEAHNVSYGVNSKKDVGTTFWFELQKSM